MSLPLHDTATRTVREFSPLVPGEPAQRQAARERQDYQAADTIRDDLHAAGVLIEDTPQGPRRELKR